jgi:hypothetical protein
MKTYYCWKCQKDLPFLDESEWSRVEPHLTQGMMDIKNYREAHGADIKTARDAVTSKAMSLFEEISGVGGVHADIIRHHRLLLWGTECNNCGWLLRSPNAKHCANCWHKQNAA